SPWDPATAAVHGSSWGATDPLLVPQGALLDDHAEVEHLDWNTCQADDGTLHDPDSCPAHRSSVPLAPVARYVLPLLRARMREPRPVYWLGLTFRGWLAEPYGRAGRAAIIGYAVGGNGHAGGVRVVSFSRRLERVPRCLALPCDDYTRVSGFTVIG